MTFSEPFRARHPGIPEQLPSGVSLEQALSELYEQGRAAWPEVALEKAAFAQDVAARFDGKSDVAEWLAGRHGEGLYLACACLQKAPQALTAFERSILSQVPLFLSNLRPTRSREVFADEVSQLLRERLLVGTPDKGPRLAEYEGQGALSSFVRVAAVRIGIDLVRKQARDPAAIEDEPVIAAAGDPELAYVKAHYKIPFKEALRAAMAALTSEERNLLRLHFVDQLSIDRLAEIFHIHRATAARWLQQARAKVIKQVHREVRARLRLDETGLQSLLEALRSQLDLSLRSWLAE